MSFDYLIVGAGLTGATLARELTDAGKQCLVIDKRNHIGGNVFTQRMDGIDVHTYGAHIFHTSNDALWQYVHRFVRMNRFTNSPIANYRGRLYNLPFNMNTFYQLWGTNTAGGHGAHCGPAGSGEDRYAQKLGGAGHQPGGNRYL